MDFVSYSLSYQLYGNTGWNYIVSDSTTEIRNNTLANWNTNGLAPGTYLLRLVAKSTTADTVEDFKIITILPAIAVSVKENDLKNFELKCYPNSAIERLLIESKNAAEDLHLSIYNVLGESVYQLTMKSNNTILDIHQLKKGIYFLEGISNEKRTRIKFVKE